MDTALGQGEDMMDITGRARMFGADGAVGRDGLRCLDCVHFCRARSWSGVLHIACDQSRCKFRRVLKGRVTITFCAHPPAARVAAALREIERHDDAR